MNERPVLFLAQVLYHYLLPLAVPITILKYRIQAWREL